MPKMCLHWNFAENKFFLILLEKKLHITCMHVDTGNGFIVWGWTSVKLACYYRSPKIFTTCEAYTLLHYWTCTEG